MTLTTILPTLRASIPDPIDLRRWPTDTRATLCDVVVGDQSMVELADLTRTPCVFEARGKVGVLVAQVVAVVGVDDSMPSYALPELILDVDPARIGGDWDEVRLIGRVSTAKTQVLALASRSPVTVELPDDVRAGDILAVPCVGSVRDEGWR